MAYSSFEEFDAAVGTRKTGYYGHGVDMYTKRDGSGERVFRVQWYERSKRYPTHEDYKKALRKQLNAAKNGFYCPAGNEWVQKNKLFNYTEKGLEAALYWAEHVAFPANEKFQEREDD